jgi:hypothetical protein
MEWSTKAQQHDTGDERTSNLDLFGSGIVEDEKAQELHNGLVSKARQKN